MVPPVALPPTLVFVPSPVTVRPAVAPVVSRLMPLPVAAPELMLLKLRPPAPIVLLLTFSPVPLAALMTLLLPVTAMAAAPLVALNPAPVVVAISSPPLAKLMVAPSLLSRFTPADVPELTRFCRPLKRIVFAPVLLFCTRMPRPAATAPMSPLRVTVPPVLFVMLTTWAPAVLLIVPLYENEPLSPLMTNPLADPPVTPPPPKPNVPDVATPVSEMLLVPPEAIVVVREPDSVPVARLIAAPAVLISTLSL